MSVCVYVPVAGQRAVHHQVLVPLAGHVASEAQEGGDVDAIHVLGLVHITAQIELRQQTLPRLLLLQATNTHTRRKIVNLISAALLLFDDLYLNARKVALRKRSPLNT